MMSSQTWNTARHLLAVQFDGVAEQMAIFPAVVALAEFAPRARITLLTTSACAPVAAMQPIFEDILVYDPPWLPGAQIAPQQTIAEEIRRGHFDGAVIFTASGESPHAAAELCAAASIPRRAGLAAGDPYLTDAIVPHPRSTHEVSLALDLVHGLGAAPDDLDLDLEIPDDARAMIFDHLAHLYLSVDDALVVFAPRSTQLHTRQVLARGARLLYEGHQLIPIPDATPAGQRLYQHLETATRHVAPRFPETLAPDQRAALIEAADVIITDDPDLMQIAAAVKTPVVALFSAVVDAARHHPWRIAHTSLTHPATCRQCTAATTALGSVCPDAITPERIVAATTALLQNVNTPLADDSLVRELLALSGASIRS